MGAMTGGQAKGLIDTTLRDGNQSLWATRMTTEMMVPILGEMDRAGYESIEYISAVQMDACVRFLGENPWDRMRIVRESITRTPLRMLGMSQYFSISKVLPDDVLELLIKTTSRYIDQRWITASMNDVRTVETSVRAALESGDQVEGGIQFTLSPVHTDEYFVDVARQLVALGVHGLVLKDAGGLLTPERVRSLLPALVRAAGELPVRCHSHCVTGLGPASNLEALQQGASSIWTATAPLSNGASLPSDQSMRRALEWMGYTTTVESAAMERIAEYFRRVAQRHGKPLGAPAEYDPRYYSHQMPGGMISNFTSQLRELGMEDRLDEVLEEMPVVRAELGYPNMQTPYSQFVATQALLNVVHGRYEVVPDEIRRFVLGYWGRPPGPLDPDVLDKAGRGEPQVSGRPGEHVPPMLARVRREMGPFDSDEDLLLAVLFMPEVLEKMRTASKGRNGAGGTVSGSLVEMVKTAAASARVRTLVMTLGSPTKGNSTPSSRALPHENEPERTEA